MKYETVYLGLGSNVGDRENFIHQAIQELDADPEIQVTKVSSFIETDPVGVTDQPKFINAVAEIKTTKSPRGLLIFVKRIEVNLGRQKRERWGPREIDIDILLYGDLTIQERDLEIPHPRMRERSFVLDPLREIAPDKVP